MASSSEDFTVPGAEGRGGHPLWVSVDLVPTSAFVFLGRYVGGTRADTNTGGHKHGALEWADEANDLFRKLRNTHDLEGSRPTGGQSSPLRSMRRSFHSNGGRGAPPRRGRGPCELRKEPRRPAAPGGQPADPAAPCPQHEPPQDGRWHHPTALSSPLGTAKHHEEAKPPKTTSLGRKLPPSNHLFASVFICD